MLITTTIPKLGQVCVRETAIVSATPLKKKGYVLDVVADVLALSLITILINSVCYVYCC